MENSGTKKCIDSLAKDKISLQEFNQRLESFEKKMHPSKKTIENIRNLILNDQVCLEECSIQLLLSTQGKLLHHFSSEDEVIQKISQIIKVFLNRLPDDIKQLINSKKETKLLFRNTLTLKNKSHNLASLEHLEKNEKPRKSKRETNKIVKDALIKGENLEKLELSNSDIIDSQFEQIIKHCPNLKDLEICSCENLSVDSLKLLPKGLTSLTLRHWPELKDSDIGKLPTKITALTLA